MKCEKLHKVLHFYYCISVAIKIARKHGEAESGINCNIFILKWLRKANKMNVFGKHAKSEMRWLRQYIEAQGPLFKHAELLIDNIYFTSMKLLRNEDR